MKINVIPTILYYAPTESITENNKVANFLVKKILTNGHFDTCEVSCERFVNDLFDVRHILSQAYIFVLN